MARARIEQIFPKLTPTLKRIQLALVYEYGFVVETLNGPTHRIDLLMPD